MHIRPTSPLHRFLGNVKIDTYTTKIPRLLNWRSGRRQLGSASLRFDGPAQIAAISSNANASPLTHQPVTNKEFMRELRRAVHRPWSPPAPAAMVRLGSWLMRTDPELALLGRRCVPTRLLSEGFVFRFPDLRCALDDLMAPP